MTAHTGLAERRDDVEGCYSNMTRQQLQSLADELRCQVNSDVIIIVS